MTDRIFNFSAGPAVLPEPVLRKAQEAIWNVAGSGIGIMEHSHRGKVFDRILDEAEQDCRDAGRHPRRLRGAVPPGRRLAPVLDGADEPPPRRPARRTTCSPASGRRRRSRRRRSWAARCTRGQQRGDQLRPDPGGGGDQVLRRTRRTCTSPPTTRSTAPSGGASPPVPAGVPLVADTSSDMYSRPIDVGKYGLIYAGAQKNLGPSGVVLVIIRKDLVEAGPKTLPTMLQYRTHAAEKSLYNTPPTFGDLPDGRGVQVDQGAGRAGGDGGAQREQGQAALRLHRPERLLPRHGAAGQPVAHERLLPRADRGAGEPSSSPRRPSAGLDGLKGHRSSAACGPASTMPVPGRRSRRWWRS